MKKGLMAGGIALGLVTLYAMGSDNEPVRRPMTVNSAGAVVERLATPTPGATPFRPGAIEKPRFKGDDVVGWCRQELVVTMQRELAEAEIHDCAVREFKRILGMKVKGKGQR